MERLVRNLATMKDRGTGSMFEAVGMCETGSARGHLHKRDGATNQRATLAMLRRQGTKPLLLVILCVTSCLPTLAQRNTGSIVGIVTDANGAVVPKAAITVTNTDTGVPRSAVTQDTGNYRIISLLPGRYKVTAASPGFQTAVREGITLDVDQDVRVDFALKPGSVQEVVTVTSEAPLVNSENGQLGTVITSKQVNDMPIFARDIFAELPMLTPGMGSARMGTFNDNADPIRLSVNGGRTFTQTVVVDGGTDSTVNIGSWGTRPLPESVQEFKVQTNAYSAENGRGTGTFNVITKGGTNQFHGQVYDYMQNEALNANSFFNIRSQLNAGKANKRGRLRDNLYGGVIGGPIKKDKIFFFMSYERHPQDSPNTRTSDVPTAAFKAGDFSALLPGTIIYDPATTRLVGGVYVRNQFADPSRATPSNPLGLNIIPLNRIDPLAAKVAAFLPAPNFTTLGQPAWAQNFYINDTTTFSSWSINPRVDFNISDRHAMFFKLKRDYGSGNIHGTWPQPNPADTQQYSPQYPNLNAVLSDTFTFRPNLINEFNASIIREVQTRNFQSTNKNLAGQIGLLNSNASLFPHFSFGAAGVNYGMGPGNALQQWLQTIQYKDTITYINGRHSLKFGADFSFNQVNKLAGRDSASGSFGFDGRYTSNVTGSQNGVGMADFLLGMPYTYTIQPPSFKWGARERSASWFVQDDWKLSPRLTVNLGLRQDLLFSWHESQNRYAAFSPTVIQPALLPSGAANPYSGRAGGMIFGVQKVDGNHLANFAPRLGFAWSLTGDQKTVLRAGAGAFFSPASTIIDYGDTGQGIESGYVPQFSATAPNKVTPLFYIQGGSGPANPAGIQPTFLAPPPAVQQTLSPALSNGFTVLWIPPGLKTPVSYNWSLTISRQLPWEILAEASYVGTRGVRLPFQRYINQTAAGGARDPITGLFDRNRLPYPQFVNIKSQFHDANSSYHAMELRLEKRYAKGLSWTVAYTLSKAMDNSSYDETTTSPGGQTAALRGSGIQDIYNLRSSWAPAYFDQRHKIAAGLIYELPIGPGKPLLNHGVLSKLIGGWQFNTFLQAQTGRPLDFVMGGPNNPNNSFSNSQFWRPNCVGTAQISNPTVDKWFDTTAFVTPANGTFGNCRRDDLVRSPGFFDTDMSLFKSFTFKTSLNESTAIQFRAEAYNALNHANFAVPDTLVPNPINTNFGKITNTIAHPRQMTLVLKLVF